jgi:hypothetical protein
MSSFLRWLNPSQQADTTYFSFLDDSKDLSNWERGAQLRNACLSFWSVKAELGLRGPRREGPVFFKIWYENALGVGRCAR